MNSGRDRDHPIELDDSDSNIQIYTPRHRRQAKDSVTQRAPTTGDASLKEPQPTIRAISPPLTRSLSQKNENFNHRFPREHLPFGQAPVVNNERNNECVPLDSTPSTDDDVVYVREVAVSVDNQLQEDLCLAKILEVFPDISQDHVRTIYQERRMQDFAIRDDRAYYDPSEILIHQIIETPSYPKQRDTKRKRPVSSNVSQEDDEKWDLDDGPRDNVYLDAAYVHLIFLSNSHISNASPSSLKTSVNV